MSKAERLAQLIVAGLMTSARPLVPGTQEAWTKHVAEFLEPHLAGEWMPIESAPKNGKIILGFCDARICTQGLVKATWSARKGFWVSPDGAEGYDLTHWQPLPAAPPKGEQS